MLRAGRGSLPSGGGMRLYGRRGGGRRMELDTLRAHVLDEEGGDAGIGRRGAGGCGGRGTDARKVDDAHADVVAVGRRHGCWSGAGGRRAVGPEPAAQLDAGEDGGVYVGGCRGRVRWRRA